ncbi:flavin reductase family protein [Kitasatospora sp. NPDC101447]|uniref:flavin reductase family protein n=1 Tax=Kitasatospora sp. NPDC101447 TaxID=3364102 RepID=UPI00381E2548
MTAGPDPGTVTGPVPPRPETPAVTGPALRSVMRRWATGVALVTATPQGRPTGCTASSFTSVSLSPPLVLVSLRRSSRTLAAITGQGAFGINLLGRHHQDLADRFATAPAEQRFAGIGHRLVRDVPVIDEAMAALVCRVERTVAAADHLLVLGQPLWCDRNGAADPLVHFGSHYQCLAVGSEPA